MLALVAGALFVVAACLPAAIVTFGAPRRTLRLVPVRQCRRPAFLANRPDRR